MKRIVLLSRVSTGLQDLDQQTTTLINTARSLGYSDDEMVVIEDKESAVKLSEEERNGLNKLKEAVNSYNIELVLVYELSRISRVPKILYSIRDFLIHHNIQLQVLNPSFKLLKTDGSIDESANVIFSLFTSMAENEGFLRKQRFARGKAKASLGNKFIGGIAPYGYTIDENNQYCVKEDEAEIIRRIFVEFKTKTVLQIAKDLILDGLYEGSRNAAGCMVRTVLRREYYTGNKTDNSGQRKNKYSKAYPAIITQKMFDDAAAKIGSRAKYSHTETKHKYICSGMIYTDTGKLMSPMKHHNTYTRIDYDCNGSKSISINITEMDNIAWHFSSLLYRAIPSATHRSTEENTSEIKAELKLIEERLKKLDKFVDAQDEKIVRIETRYISGKISDSIADKLRSDVNRETESYKLDKRTLEDRRKTLNTKLNNLTGQDLRFMEELSFDDKKRIVSEEIKKVIVSVNGRKHKHIRMFSVTLNDYIECDYDPYRKKIINI